jgi:hypothetical protein
MSILAFAIAALLVHHGNIAYDGQNPITLKGTVTEFLWTNPHCQIYFDVKNEKGEIVHWAAESLSPGRLTRAGWRRNSVKAGDGITLTLIPAKNNAPVGYLQKLIIDGTGQELGIQDRPTY